MSAGRRALPWVVGVVALLLGTALGAALGPATSPPEAVPAPAPTVTMAGRPACSMLAAASVATSWSLARWSGVPACDTTSTGVSAGQPASSRRRLSAPSWRPAM